MSDGFIAFGNDELDESPPLKAGEMILCPHCGQGHSVSGGTDSQTGEPTEMLLFYRCGDSAYLAGIDGRNVMRRFMGGGE